MMFKTSGNVDGNDLSTGKTEQKIEIVKITQFLLHVVLFI